MFGKKKEMEGMDGMKTGNVEGNNLDIPAPKGPVARPVVAPPRPQSATAGIDIARRPGPSVSSPSQPSSEATDLPTASVAESRKLVVGREIRLKGEVTSCDVLVVEGSVELSLTDARQIHVAESGLFTGKVEVAEAEIAGQFEGELTVRESLIVRPGGRVTGRVRYGNIVVEAGGQIAGEVESLASQASRGRLSVEDSFRRSELTNPGLAAVETEPAGTAEDK
ncbi:MAG: bactofilin family protein [Hyphomicrobium sp.]|jgi:cytoskeletal protein CcmA (bactofilin family)